MSTHFIRLLLGTLLFCAASAAAASSAAAFTVKACRDAPGNVNRSWVASKSSATIMSTSDGCNTPGTYAGLTVYENLGGPPHATSADYAWWTVSAPAGTTITGLDYSRWLHAYSDAKWKPELRTGEGTVLETCTFSGLQEECEIGQSGGLRRFPAFTGLSTASLSVGGRCVPGSGFTGCERGATLHRLETVVYGATVTLVDTQDPTITGSAQTTLPSGWAKPPNSGSITVDASNNTGIKARRFYVDGQLKLTETPTAVGACQDLSGDAYTYLQPCAGTRGLNGSRATTFDSIAG